MNTIIAQLEQLAKGYVCDGDLISKDARDHLNKAGLVERNLGWNFLTGKGVEYVANLGMLSTNRKSSDDFDIAQRAVLAARMDEVKRVREQEVKIATEQYE